MSDQPPVPSPRRSDQAPGWCESTLRGQAARCSAAAEALRESALRLHTHLTVARR